MKNFVKICTFLLVTTILSFGLIACNATTNDDNPKTKKMLETFELSTATLGDVEFENSDTVKLDKKDNEYVVSGSINAMSESQVVVYGVDEVTHVVSLKLTFDKERTISSFEIDGKITKVYSDNKNVENYVGSLSDLLDNEDGEDAFCYLVLSANTKEYEFKVTYTDKTTSEFSLKINATLATAIED